MLRSGFAFRRCLPSTTAARTMGMYRSPTQVELYFDTASPHCWVQFELLHRYRERWNLEVSGAHLFPSCKIIKTL